MERVELQIVIKFLRTKQMNPNRIQQDLVEENLRFKNGGDIKKIMI